MQNALQVDGRVFPGNRQMKVWLPGRAAQDRNRVVAREPVTL